MRTVIRVVLAALVVAVSVGLAVAAAGCGSSGGGAGGKDWKLVTTAEFSGAKPIKVTLGTHPLDTEVRLAWNLSGAGTDAVMLTFRTMNVDTGNGFGAAIGPRESIFQLKDDEVFLFKRVSPGYYRMFFTQRFPPGQGPGYDGTVSVYTR